MIEQHKPFTSMSFACVYYTWMIFTKIKTHYQARAHGMIVVRMTWSPSISTWQGHRTGGA
jgi:hypothetical protein